MKRVLVVGATSAIAVAVLRELAQRGCVLLLAGRNTDRLNALANDLEARGAALVEVHHYDASEPGLARGLAQATWGEGLDTLLLAHGSLPEQSEVQDDPQKTLDEFQVNALSPIELLSVFAPRFDVQGSGAIAVISSVAGDRGRQSNYLYGSAKSALSAYSQGLRNRLCKRGVSVVTVKPGFVDTPMTASFDKGILWASPQRVAKDILRSLDGPGGVLYTPGFWRYIMWVIRLIPERVFSRLSL